MQIQMMIQRFLTRKFCLSRAHALIPQGIAIMKKDPKFRVFIENGLFEGKNKTKDKGRHADTNGNANLLTRKVCPSRAHAIIPT